MSFFRMCPRDYVYNNHVYDDIPLKVIQDDGIDISPDFKVDITDLNKGYKHFNAKAGHGTSFKISVIIHKNQKIRGIRNTRKQVSKSEIEKEYVEVTIDGELMVFEKENLVNQELTTVWHYQNVRLTTLLNWFMRQGIPFMITTDMIGIDMSVPYMITENKSRKQTSKDYTIWELTFTRWDEVFYSSFKKTNKGITNAIKKLKAKKKAKAKAKAKAKTAVRQKLAKCKRKTLVYSKKQKTVDCVKVLQKFLNGNLKTKLVIDGWYGKETVKAVKKFQNKYKKKYGLKPTGNVNKATFNVMIGKTNTTTKKTTGKPKKSNGKPKAIKTIVLSSNTKGIISNQLTSKNALKGNKYYG